MNLNDYQAEAQNTKSDKFYGEKISLNQFKEVVFETTRILKKLDLIKKALFYNKPAEMFAPSIGERNCIYMLNNISSDTNVSIDLIHGIVGKATEASELLEALLNSINTGARLDGFNVAEEIGDGFWYDAIMLQALKLNFESCAQVNNKKLRARFPNKFTEADAINRNLAKERAILEGENGLGKSHNIGFEIDAVADLDD